MTIPKNPSISNISDTSATGTEPTEWVAMTVRYYLIDGEDKYYFRKSDGKVVGLLQLRHTLNEYLEIGRASCRERV